LVANGQMVTTIKRSRVLKSVADKFFGRLVRLYQNNDEATAKREAIRYVKSLIYTEKEGKKVIQDLLPRFVEQKKTS
jgi:ribosomal protein L17